MRTTALLVLSSFHGALTLARAVGDSSLPREILQAVRKRLDGLGAAGEKPRARPSIKNLAPAAAPFWANSPFNSIQVAGRRPQTVLHAADLFRRASRQLKEYS